MSSALMAQREALQQAKLTLAAMKQNRQNAIASKSPQPNKEPVIVLAQNASFAKAAKPIQLPQPSEFARKTHSEQQPQLHGSPEYKTYPNEYKLAKSLAFQRASLQNASDTSDKKSASVLNFTPQKKEGWADSARNDFDNNYSQGNQRRTASSRRGKSNREGSAPQPPIVSGDTSKDVYSLEEIKSEHTEDSREHRQDETDEYIYSVDNDESLQQLNGNTPGKRSGQRSPKSGKQPAKYTPEGKKSGEGNSVERKEIRLSKTKEPFEESEYLQISRTGQAKRSDPKLQSASSQERTLSQQRESKAADLESSYSTRQNSKKNSGPMVQSAYSMSNLSKPMKHIHDDDYWVIKQKIKKAETAFKIPNSPEMKYLQASLSQSTEKSSKYAATEPLREQQHPQKQHRAQETGSRESERHRLEQLQALKLALKNKRSSSSQPVIQAIQSPRTETIKRIPAQPRKSREKRELPDTKKQIISASSTEFLKAKKPKEVKPASRETSSTKKQAEAPQRELFSSAIPPITSPKPASIKKYLPYMETESIDSKASKSKSSKPYKKQNQVTETKEEEKQPRPRRIKPKPVREESNTSINRSDRSMETKQRASKSRKEEQRKNSLERARILKEKETELENQRREFAALEAKKAKILEKKRRLEEKEKLLQNQSSPPAGSILAKQGLEELKEEPEELNVSNQSKASNPSANGQPQIEAIQPPEEKPVPAKKVSAPKRSPRVNKSPKSPTQPESQDTPLDWRKPAVPRFGHSKTKTDKDQQKTLDLTQEAEQTETKSGLALKKPGLPAEARRKRRQDNKSPRPNTTELDASNLDDSLPVHERLYRQVRPELQAPSFKQLLQQEKSLSPTHK